MARLLFAVFMFLSVTLISCIEAKTSHTEDEHEVITREERKLERHTRDFTDNTTNVLYCTSHCGGQCKDTCPDGTAQQSCHCPGRKKCCVDTTCLNCDGGCFNLDQRQEDDLGMSQAPPGCNITCPTDTPYCCYRGCISCGGQCEVNCSAGYYELNDPKCPCINQNEKCCVPIVNCTSDLIKGDCKDNCSSSELNLTKIWIHRVARKIHCPDNKSCCVPDCVCAEGTNCTREYPGRGRCTVGTCLDNEIAKYNMCNIETTNPANCTCCIEKLPPGDGGGKPGVEGDPWYTTFDRHRYHFMGKPHCSYTIFQPCNVDPEYRVSVYLVPGKIRKRDATFISGINVEYHGHRIELRYDDVMIDGKLVSPDQDIDVTDGLSLRHSHGLVDVMLDSKFKIIWNSIGTVHVELNESQHGLVCGLMGNADGFEGNDLQWYPGTKNTVHVQDAKDVDVDLLGESWLVPGSC